MADDQRIAIAMERIARALEAIAKKNDPEFKTAAEERQEDVRQRHAEPKK